MKTCKKCGVEKESNEFGIRSDRKIGFRPTCKKCEAKKAKTHYIINPDFFKNKRKIWVNNNKLLNKYTQYISNAKRRNYIFELTLEQFTNIVLQTCHYCGNEENNGVDRKDNTKGYILNNCISCCKDCNIAKRNRTYDNYIIWLNKSFKYLNK